jgi:hypothetical protein
MAPGRRAASPPASTSAPGGGAPWRADPDRARAAREQARRRAGGGKSGAGAGSGAAPGATGARSTGTSGTRGKPGASGSSGSAGRGGAAGESRGGAGAGRAAGATRGRRNVRKATLGSTSYDEARDPRDPNDPSWSGAAWYGPSTGEYWIINPREYADPRKHGPEYQSRARRMAEAGADGGSAMDVDEAEAGRSVEFGAEPAPAEEQAAAAAGASAASRRGATASARRAEAPPFAGRHADQARSLSRAETLARTERPRSGWSPGARSRSQAATWALDPRSLRADARTGARRTLPRDLIVGPADDPIRRLGIALVAWPPIGLAAAAAIGDVTGCAVYSADCGSTEPLLPWLAQAVILGLLLLLPPVARLLAGGAIGVLVALVPLTAFLVAVGGTGAPQAGFALAFLLTLAWLVGVAWSIAETRRRTVARAGP